MMKNKDNQRPRRRDFQQDTIFKKLNIEERVSVCTVQPCVNVFMMEVEVCAECCSSCSLCITAAAGDQSFIGDLSQGILLLLLPADTRACATPLLPLCCVMFLLTSPVSCNYYYQPAPDTAPGGHRGPPTLSSSNIIEP